MNLAGTDEQSEAEDGRSQHGARPSLSRAVRPSIVVLSYLLLACLVYWPVSPFSSTRIIDCACSDPVQEVWFLHWAPWAVAHGSNPFFTQYLNAPSGANLALNTSFPLLGLIGAPVTFTAGPLVTYNILLRVALGLSAAAMYWLLRRYTTWWLAAYAGGLLFGFSPYMIGHAHRHLFLTFLPLVPLFIAVADDWLVRARRNPYLCGGLMGLLTGMEFLISPEVTVLTVMAVVVGLLVIAARYRHEVRRRLALLVKGLGPAVGVLAVTAGPAIYVFLHGAQRPVGALHKTTDLYRYRANLAVPFVPTSGELIDPTTVGDRFVNHSVVENGFYLGLPLLALVLFAVLRYWRKPLVLAAAVVGMLAFVLGLGSSLDFHGRPILQTMPFDVVARLPLLKNIEPARFSLFVQLAVAVVLAVALDHMSSRVIGNRVGASARPALRAAVATLVAVVALVPLIPQTPLRTATVHVPRFFTSNAVRAIPQGSLILTYPYNKSPQNDPMLWQSASDMRFRIFGGDAFVPRADGTSTWRPYPPAPPNIDSLLGLARKRVPEQALARRLSQFLPRYHVSGVVIDPAAKGAGRAARVVTAALSAPPRSIQGVQLWLAAPGRYLS